MWDTSQRFMCGGTEKHDGGKDGIIVYLCVCRIWAMSVWVETGVCVLVYMCVCVEQQVCQCGVRGSLVERQRVYLHKWVCVCVKGETEMCDVCDVCV